jgi:hypothetical protein
MLHATIRTSREALHFIGAVSPYSLRTLQQYMREARRDEQEVRLCVELEAADEREFSRHAQRWLGHLRRRGVQVDIDVDRSGSLWPVRHADYPPSGPPLAT